jgi:glycosyltransferase involved in cell wall biosynthesis
VLHGGDGRAAESAWAGAARVNGRGPARVLFVTDVAEIGGAERRLVDLARHADPQRFVPVFCVLSSDGPLLDDLRGRGFACHALGVRSGRDYPWALLQLLRLIRAVRPHIVHGQIRYASFMAALAGRLSRVPVVVASRTYTARFGNHVALDAWTSRLADLTIAVSRASAEVVRREESVGAERLRVVPNGIDLDAFRPPAPAAVEAAARELGLEGWRVVGTVGHLHAIKGHRDLLDAARVVVRARPRTKVLLVGDGPLDRDLMAFAAGRGLAEHVVFAGFRRDVATLLGVMDVFVLPSLNEGMSHALLEAMALGKPVVATAVGGNREVVDAEATGLLVPPGDPAALGRAVLRVLDDPGLAARLGDAARAAVHARFSDRRMAEEYFAIYDALLARRRGAA